MQSMPLALISSFTPVIFSSKAVGNKKEIVCVGIFHEVSSAFLQGTQAIHSMLPRTHVYEMAQLRNSWCVWHLHLRSPEKQILEEICINAVSHKLFGHRIYFFI